MMEIEKACCYLKINSLTNMTETITLAFGSMTFMKLFSLHSSLMSTDYRRHYNESYEEYVDIQITEDGAI